MSKKQGIVRFRTSGQIMASCANERSRYAINAPLVVVKGDKGVIAGTDGRIAAVRPVHVEPAGDGDEQPSVRAIMPERGLGNATKRSSSFQVEMDEESSQITKLSSSGQPASRLSMVGKNLEGTFPPMADIYPQRGKGRFVAVCLDPERLYNAMIAVHDEDRQGRVMLYVPLGDGKDGSDEGDVIIRADTKPVLAVGVGRDAGAALVMPCSIEGTDPVAMLEMGRDLFNQTGA